MKDLNKLGVEELQILEHVETTGGCSFAYDVGFALRLMFSPSTTHSIAAAGVYNVHCS